MTQRVFGHIFVDIEDKNKYNNPPSQAYQIQTLFKYCITNGLTLTNLIYDIPESETQVPIDYELIETYALLEYSNKLVKVKNKKCDVHIYTSISIIENTSTKAFTIIANILDEKNILIIIDLDAIMYGYIDLTPDALDITRTMLLVSNYKLKPVIGCESNCELIYSQLDKPSISSETVEEIELYRVRKTTEKPFVPLVWDY